MELSHQADIHWGLSLKKDGPMKSHISNRTAFLQRQGLSDKLVASANLAHGARVAVVKKITASSIFPACDALITQENNCILTITVADCLPIYFYDTKQKVVALAHAGWRGIVANLIPATIKAFIDNYHSRASDIIVDVGPHIQACHFEIKKDIFGQFAADDLSTREGHVYAKLSAVVRKQLLALGVKPDNLKISSECTYCASEKYFSCRRDRHQTLETMLAYIGLK